MLYESLRRYSAYPPPLYRLSTVAYASYPTYPGLGLNAVAPYGFVSEQYLSWGPELWENCLLIYGAAEAIVAFHGVTSVPEVFSIVLASDQVDLSNTPGRIARWAHDTTLTGAAPIVAALEAYRTVNGYPYLKLVLVGHSQGCGQAERLWDLLRPLPTLSRYLPASVRFAGPRVLDPIAARAFGGPSLYLINDVDFVPTLPPQIWVQDWPVVSTWFGGTNNYRHRGAGRILSSGGGFILHTDEDEGILTGLSTLAAVNSITTDPTAHLIGSYEGRLSVIAGALPLISPDYGVPEMPATPPLVVDDVLEVTFRAQADSQEVINRVHYKASALAGAGPVTGYDVAAGLRLLWQANMLPLLATTYRLLTTEVKRVDGIIQGIPTVLEPRPFTYLYGWGAQFASPATDVGTLAGTPLPTYTTASVRKLTAFTGRYWRGGIHIGPISESVTLNLGNELDPAFAALLYAGIGVVINQPILTALPPVVASTVTLQALIVSGTYGGWIVPGTPLSASAPLTDWPVSPFVGTQVSRKRRLS